MLGMSGGPGGRAQPSASAGAPCPIRRIASTRRDTRLPFDTFKKRLADAPADIRIAILDSCRSGALTRTKGARRAPAFEIDSGATRDARGLVILTSSSADEDSQGRLE